MSITDELRECIAAMCKVSGLDGGRLYAIADRIDIAHKHAIGYVDDRDPETMAENGWVKLPVDADGVPIRVGDEVRWPDGETAEVVGIGENTLFYIEHGFDDSAQWTAAHNKRHVQPDTWERIIEDAAKLVRGDNDAVMELVGRCRRLAGER